MILELDIYGEAMMTYTWHQTLTYIVTSTYLSYNHDRCKENYYICDEQPQLMIISEKYLPWHDEWWKIPTLTVYIKNDCAPTT